MLAFAGLWTYTLDPSPVMVGVVVLTLGTVWGLAISVFFNQLVRPLQTLANVVSALREDDYSFRARGALRNDALGDLALEINALAATLQQQRSAALDALTLVERVLSSMQSPVLAFDEAGTLKLLNAAARSAFAITERNPIGRTALELNLESLLDIPDQGLYPPADPSGNINFVQGAVRWSVRRAVFRLHGLPNTLFVLSDVGAVLREEERTAWQRLIRVLSHEINNSLTPIQSIAGSLRHRMMRSDAAAVDPADLLRGLGVIEDRSASLNRFLQAYQRLTRLPAPTLQRADLAQLIVQVVHLETRLKPHVEPGPAVHLLCDPDQIQQALINLLQNAADAALSQDSAARPDASPAVQITWTVHQEQLSIFIEDNGPGITNPGNLFVPFYTTKAKGTGIGLVLAQQIATAHHGSVTLHSARSGTGCVAQLNLPL
ncbi:multi-sensor signal transduction histidine kinase [Granulicella tundricola MP5ACTX9]|uniref:histidine kinase n=2 Tax=Granulicella TaxID=940557 RepID=E8WY88_GRATM|nr:multi-sensor signal transduction histidine kinase [Granulicella tundricola MP5ACTX9]